MPVIINGTTGIETPGLDANPGVVQAETLSVNNNNISAVNSLGFRNRIINGDMRIDQRNAGAGVPGPGLAYTVDRWAVLTSTGSGNAFQQISDAPTGFNNSLRITVGTGASPTSGQQNIIFQPIEGFNLADLGFGAAGASSITASFWVKSSVAGTYSSWFQNSGSTRSYIATFTISSANTWEYKTVTVPGDTSGTWLKTNGVGLLFGFSIGAGSTYQNTASAWVTGDFKGTAGSVNLVATSGATFQITGVQLEAGSVATPFERRDYGRELIMCQRYYQFTAFGADSIVVAIGFNSTSAVAGYGLLTQMRVAPTVSFTGTVTANLPGLGGITFTSPSANGFLKSIDFYFAGGSSLSAGYPAQLNGGVATFNAEM